MSIASRITEMEQHIGNAYDKIEDLGIDLTDVDKNIDNISSMLENVWDEYPKVSATDVEEATLENTKKGRMEIDLKGQTQQDGEPTPESPVPIQNVTGNANVKIQNKNLFDKTTVAQRRFIRNTDGTLGYSDTLSASDFIPVKANISYYQSNVNNYYSCLYDKNKNFIRQINSNAFTPTVDGYMRTSFLTTNTDIVQIEQGTTATSYVAHQEQNLPFTLAEGQRAMQGTTLEDDGIHNKRKQIVLDGTENWQYYQNNIFYCILNIPNIIRNTIAVNCLSDSYIAVNSSSSASDFETLSTNYNYSINTHITQNIIRIKDKRFTSANNFKSSLALKPITVEYKLETEEIIPYNETQQAQYNAIKQAKGYNHQTNILQTYDELPFILDIEALKNN